MKLALLGYPLSHSLSPAMHNAALAAVGLRDWHYESMPVAPGQLAGAVATIRSGDYAGANVTVPHKESIIPLLDGLTPVAQAIGAVNTIIKPNRRHSSPSLSLPAMKREVGGQVLIGHNTDAAGLLTDLYARGVRISQRPVLILGAGGAARAAVAACAGANASAPIRIIARRREQAETLRAITPPQIFDWTPLGFLQASDHCALVLNTTPVGMTPYTSASPWIDGAPFPPEAFVYDLVYNPAETLLVRQARAHGLRAANGLGMLVEQGALAFELWTERRAPRDLMRQAAEAQLNSSWPSHASAPLHA